MTSSRVGYFETLVSKFTFLPPGLFDISGAADILAPSLPLSFSHCHCVVVSLSFCNFLGEYKQLHNISALPPANAV